MSKTHRSHEDDILNDGDVLRVSMFSMDALDPVQRAIALTKQQFNNTDAALRRPGYRFVTGDAANAALDAVHQARLEYLDTLTNAWRGDQAGTQGGARATSEKDEDEDEDNGGGRRRTQYRDPEGREAGTAEEFADRLRRAQDARRRATDAAYADAEQHQRDAYKNLR